MVGAIIFGADVTHPTLEQTSTPSVAAVSITQFHTIRMNLNNIYSL